MQIAKEIAGFSPAEAETLRKAIGKKIHELMASLKDKFLEGCAENGVTPGVAKQLWKDMEQSQDYSFNKAHSACYALIAYRTAWLKANHPLRVHGRADLVGDEHEGPRAALRQRVPRDGDRGAAAGRERVAERLRRRRGQDPLRPERGQERGRVGARGDHRRARGGRPVRVDLGLHRARRPAGGEQARRSSRSSSAARSTRLGDTRMGMLEASSSSRSRVRPARPGRPARGPGLDLRRSGVGRARREAAARATTRRSRAMEFEKRELLSWRRRSLGLYVSEHPLHGGARAAAAQDRLPLAELERRRDGEIVTVGGIVSAVQAADDEERRADGVPAARRPDRRRRGRRLQLRLRRARASSAWPTGSS